MKARPRNGAITAAGSPDQLRDRALELGLTNAEFDLICEKLGRRPNELELAIFSLLWSEHCGYKHSRRLLRRFPRASSRLVFGPGENAGAVDVGGGFVAAFKIESHNHPSAIEPFQGAATGVGGILRDVLALGARPIAVLDSLRFGEPDSARSRYLLDGVVRGIAHYGNAVGVPTVGGEIYFDRAYEQNCLVNAMCVGIARREQLVRSAAAGPGNRVLLLGALTGRDGIGGASVLASADLDESDTDKRPSVQIGDPFEEKKLIECCLELVERRLLVALQDLGAAGLSSSAAEMAAKGGVGIDIEVRRVPLREPEMEPFEIMISESQERMLCVVEPARVDEVTAICARHEVRATIVGQVTTTGQLRVFDNGRLVGEIPARLLVDECPTYELRGERPPRSLYPPPRPRLDAPADLRQQLLTLLGSPNLCSRLPVYEQYDWLVGSRTVLRPGEADAAVLLVDPEHDSRRAVAVATDGNGWRVAADPYRGSVEAVLECAANLACVGATPLGLTNCLNFGNPERPWAAWQLEHAVQGLADACRALGIPVVGGNVSLYNESERGPILPSPIVGMLGLVEDAANAPRAGFAREGDAIVLVGPGGRRSLAASELSRLRGEGLPEALAEFDPGDVIEVLARVRDAARQGILASAHDVAEGGLLVALAECALLGGLGAEVELDSAAEEELFGEGPGWFVVSGPRHAVAPLGQVIGVVGGERLRVRAGRESLDLALDEMRVAWSTPLAAALAGP